MNDEELAALGFTSFVILCLIVSAFGFLNMGAFLEQKTQQIKPQLNV